MVPIAIEELRPDMRDELETYIQRNPDSFVARLKPRLVSENGIHCWLQHGADLEHGVAGFGSSIEEAIANFENLCAAFEKQTPGRLK
jgi:hypothetical protein